MTYNYKFAMRYQSPKIFVLRMIARILISLHNALIRFAQILVPPQLTLLEQIGGITSTHLISTAAHFKIPDLLATGPKSAEEIANHLKVNPDAVFRMMRSLATLGTFKLCRNGKFQNNRLSLCLASNFDNTLRDFALYFGSSSNTKAWSHFIHTVQTGENAFENLHQISIWTWFKLNPNEGEVFTRAMMNLTRMDALLIAQSYPFKDLQKVCDVAGGQGTLLAEILEHHPHLNAVLCDEKYVLEKARTYLESRKLDLRVEHYEGNFFESVPNGCDGYLMKDILHDWDDERCIQILKCIQSQLGVKSRILILEVLVDPFTAKKPGPLMDVHMMTVCSGGRQRSIHDLNQLFNKSGLKMGRIFLTPSPLSIVEAWPL